MHRWEAGNPAPDRGMTPDALAAPWVINGVVGTPVTACSKQEAHLRRIGARTSTEDFQVIGEICDL